MRLNISIAEIQTMFVPLLQKNRYGWFQEITQNKSNQISNLDVLQLTRQCEIKYIFDRNEFIPTSLSACIYHILLVCHYMINATFGDFLGNCFLRKQTDKC